MLIERTIRVDGHCVTVTQRVDTGQGPSNETVPLKKAEVAYGVELGVSHEAALEIRHFGRPNAAGEPERPGDGGEPERPGDGGQPERPGDGGEPERPGDGGEQERPGDGGQMASGITIIFGPVNVYCSDAARANDSEIVKSKAKT